MLEELYKAYGEEMIQLEILQNKINKTKNQIVEELNKKNRPTSPEKE
jgi:hypothetical protein